MDFWICCPFRFRRKQTRSHLVGIQSRLGVRELRTYGTFMLPLEHHTSSRSTSAWWIWGVFIVATCCCSLCCVCFCSCWLSLSRQWMTTRVLWCQLMTMRMMVTMGVSFLCEKILYGSKQFWCCCRFHPGLFRGRRGRSAISVFCIVAAIFLLPFDGEDDYKHHNDASFTAGGL